MSDTKKKSPAKPKAKAAASKPAVKAAPPAPKRPKSTTRQEIAAAREDMLLAQRRLMRLNSFDPSHEEYGDIADAEAALAEAEAAFMALSNGWYPARNGKR